MEGFWEPDETENLTADRLIEMLNEFKQCHPDGGSVPIVVEYKKGVWVPVDGLGLSNGFYKIRIWDSSLCNSEDS